MIFVGLFTAVDRCKVYILGTTKSMVIQIRSAVPSDSESIGSLISEFHSYLRQLGDTTDLRFGAEAYLRDGFGDRPAFAGVVAELGQTVVGYALYHDGYDTDKGQRVVYLVDLYVQRLLWRRGVGTALMKRVAEIGRERAARAMVWSVFKLNHPAARFYERLGAKLLTDVDWMYLDL